MGYFSAAVEAKLEGRQVAPAMLCHMDFAVTPRRWWSGFGPLTAGGQEWLGTGELIQVEGLEQPIGTSAPKTTFTVSGVDPVLVGLARQASDRVKNRRCTVYLQFFDLTPINGQPWQLLDAPYAIWSGIMDQMTYIAEGPAQRRILLTAEGLWTNRRRPPFGYYTDRDQNQRFSGDRGLEQVSALVNKTIYWPVY